MSDTNNERQSEQPAEVTPAPDAGEQQAPPDAATQVETATKDQLEAALFGDFTDPEEPSQPAEEPAPQPGAEEAKENEESREQQQSPESESPAPSESPAETPIRERISLKGIPAEQRKETAQAAELVRSGQAKDMFDALSQIRGVTQNPAAPDTEQPAPDASSQAPETTQTNELTDLESKRNELRQQREAAAADYDQAEVTRLTNEIEDVGIQIAEARAEAKVAARSQQQSAAAYEQQVDAAFDAMEAKYPEVLNQESKFHQLLQDKIDAAEARQDPALRDPNYVLKFAEEIHGILNPGPKAPPPPKPTPAAKPVGQTVAPAHSAVQRYTEGQKSHAIHTASMDELGAALFGG